MPHYRSPGHIGDARSCSFVNGSLENSVDNAALSRGIRLLYQALTAIRKDCSRIGKKHRRASGAKADASALAPMMVRVRSGNGEQPWL
jgi:hypothetical protein